MKTLEQFNSEKQELELDEFLCLGDEIDEEMYWHICCGYLPEVYSMDGIVQGGDPCRKVGEAYTYLTAIKKGDKYYYLGELPEFKQHKYEGE